MGRFQYHRYRWAIGLIVLLLIAFSEGALLGHYLGSKQGKQSAAELSSQAAAAQGKLRAQLQAVSNENVQLKEQMVILESSSKVDRLAVLDAQTAMAEMQKQLSEAKQEVDLYRRIGSAEKPEQTLSIQDFQIVRDTGLQYRLTLSQGVGQPKEVAGTVEIAIVGRMNSEQRILTLKDFDKEHSEGLTFQFQYFQLLSGSIDWPQAFVPESVEVQVISETAGIRSIKRRWLWQELSKT